MARVSGWQWVCGVIVFCAVTAGVSTAQDVFTTLVNFDRTDGAHPEMVLTQGVDGNFYGTTLAGGNYNCSYSGCGTVFKMIPTGALTTLYTFCSKKGCIDGEEPMGSLLQAIDGDIYGVTQYGGTYHSDCERCGTIFKITPEGTLSRFYSFCALANCADGGLPMGGLAQDSSGNFYGTTTFGGANNAGTVFEITPGRKLTTLYSFCALAACADGDQPSGSLVQAANGNFYGTTSFGGTNGVGTIFEITPGGKFITLHNFNGVDGSLPDGLIQAADGNLYGTTIDGGTRGGTIFKITAGGKLTTLHNFCTPVSTRCTDGVEPFGPLVQANDGNFYGTTYAGGADYLCNGGCGSVFEITPAGALTTLYNLCGYCGSYPQAGLLQAANGIFYGTTVSGESGNGTIFSLGTGLAPFVSFVRNPAKVGQQFGILGYGLTGTSGVSLNGIAAKFVTQSDTLLIATVPPGAMSGYVTVTTPSGTLTSNVPFRVLP